MKICVNAGHCYGVDPGAIGQRGTHEAYVNKVIAGYVKKYLEQKGHDVVYVSEKSLAKVCAVSNDNKCNYFVSIHCNAATNKKAQGTETFYYRGRAKGKRLAKAINDEIVKTLETRDRGIKDTTSLYVVKRTNAPAVLVECAFISNLDDEKLLIDKAKIFAQAIVRGIVKGIK